MSSFSAMSLHICIQLNSRSILRSSRMTPVLNPRPWQHNKTPCQPRIAILPCILWNKASSLIYIKFQSLDKCVHIHVHSTQTHSAVLDYICLYTNVWKDTKYRGTHTHWSMNTHTHTIAPTHTHPPTPTQMHMYHTICTHTPMHTRWHSTHQCRPGLMIFPQLP